MNADMIDIRLANARHDREHGNPHQWARVRSGWNEQMLTRGDVLDDRAVAKYAAAGYYSAGYREARRELQERRKAQAEARAKRSGNFVQEGGRLIYRP